MPLMKEMKQMGQKMGRKVKEGGKELQKDARSYKMVKDIQRHEKRQQKMQQRKIQLEKMQILSQWFEHFDRDRTGRLNREEVVLGMQHTLASNGSRSDPQIIRDTIHSIWPMFDRDGKGTIDRFKFCAPGGLGERLVAMMNANNNPSRPHATTGFHTVGTQPQAAYVPTEYGMPAQPQPGAVNSNIATPHQPQNSFVPTEHHIPVKPKNVTVPTYPQAAHAPTGFHTIPTQPQAAHVPTGYGMAVQPYPGAVKSNIAAPSQPQAAVVPTEHDISVEPENNV